MSVGRSDVLWPDTSATGLAGMASGYQDSAMGLVCHLRKLRDSCWRHRV